MVIATPFAEDRQAFYYNQKINCMRASGMVTIGDQTYAFDPADATATLDWGRGVWTYHNTCYWGSAIGVISSDQHQVFGTFDGTAICDDGTVIELKQFLGFAERVENRW